MCHEHVQEPQLRIAHVSRHAHSYSANEPTCLHTCPGQLKRAAVELAKMWRQDKVLRHLQVGRCLSPWHQVAPGSAACYGCARIVTAVPPAACSSNLD
jgi:hypothetical protein